MERETKVSLREVESIYDKEYSILINKKSIGRVIVYNEDLSHVYLDEGELEIGYEIDEAYRHHGYGIKVVKKALEKLFSLRYKRIYAVYDKHNTASYRLLLNCGFSHEDKLDDDTNCLSITLEEYRKAYLEDLEKKLYAHQDLKYRSFHQGLIPNVDQRTLIGIRVPEMRKIAKELSKCEDYVLFLDSLPHTYYEENLIHMLLIGEIKDYALAMSEVKKFLPYIDNWAVCDAQPPKIFDKRHKEVLTEASSLLTSSHTYTVRYGIGLYRHYGLKEEYTYEDMYRIASIDTEEYYINMMISWYLATCMIDHYEDVYELLKTHKLSYFVHHKTIQKAVESRRISTKHKEELKLLRYRSA